MRINLSTTKPIKDYVVFDLETTGFSPKTETVVEIAALKVIDNKVSEEFHYLVNPNMHIPEQSTAIHGINDFMVKDCPEFDVVLKKFRNFTDGFVLVGHNIHNFDLKFINRDALIYLGSEFPNDYVDTLILSNIYVSKEESHTLTGLVKYFGLETEDAHHALSDCLMNQRLFERLQKEGMDLSLKEPDKFCPECGCPLKLRKGKFGQFYGCWDYPNCCFTRNI